MNFKKIIPVLAAVIAGMCFSASAVSFTDVEEHWAKEQILEYAEKGIVNGYPDGTFMPDKPVTREEFCKIMLNSFGMAVQASEKASFSDVSDDVWSYEFVETAKKYLPGYTDGTYLPENAASRDDVTAAIVKLMGYPVGVVTDENLALTKFSDCESIASEILPYVSLAVEKGLVTGFPEGVFKPKEGITRAEALTLVSRAVKTYEEKAFSWDDAVKYIDAYYGKNDDDTKVVMSVNNYDVSVSEYRYYYGTYVDMFSYYFSDEWKTNKELTDAFNSNIDNSTKLTGVLYGLCNENALKLSLRDINEQIFYQFESMDMISKSYGIDIVEYLGQKHATPNYMLVNCLAYAFSNELMNSMYGSDSEFYKEFSADIEKDYVRAKHVLVMFAGKSSKEEAYKLAETVYNKAISGENFDTLINQYNEDPGMDSNPDGYVFTYGQMVEPFEKATFALSDGEISGIVETEYGYHIIKKLALDAKTITSSAAYQNSAGAAFDEFLADKAESIEPVENENTSLLLMEIFESTGYGADEKADDNGNENDNDGGDIDVSTATAEEVINAINSIEAPEFMYMVMPIDMTDADALKMFTGLDSAEGIKDVAVCESMMGSQAYSLVVVKLENEADAKKIAEAMKAGIDPRKWICVEADDIKVSAKGNTVMFIMIDSEYKEFISASSVTEAFKTICGGELDFEF